MPSVPVRLLKQSGPWLPQNNRVHLTKSVCRVRTQDQQSFFPLLQATHFLLPSNVYCFFRLYFNFYIRIISKFVYKFMFLIQSLSYFPFPLKVYIFVKHFEATSYYLCYINKFAFKKKDGRRHRFLSEYLYFPTPKVHNLSCFFLFYNDPGHLFDMTCQI